MESGISIRQKAPLGRVLAGHMPFGPHDCAWAGSSEQLAMPRTIQKKRILPLHLAGREDITLLPIQLGGMHLPLRHLKIFISLIRQRISMTATHTHGKNVTH
jgi:hypothetical protein